MSKMTRQSLLAFFASISMIASSGTDNNIAEKGAPPNLTPRAFEVINDVKAALERECKGVVSCADILAPATRGGVSLSGGVAYALPTGRRDGTVSSTAEVHAPGPSFSVRAAFTAFQTISLDYITRQL